jgi:hypothetical protein
MHFLHHQRPLLLAATRSSHPRLATIPIASRCSRHVSLAASSSLLVDFTAPVRRSFPRTPQQQLRSYSSYQNTGPPPPPPQPKMVGEDFDDILKGKYPAKAHARRVAQLIAKDDASKSVNGILYVEAQPTKMIEDDDGSQPFR